MLNYQRVGTSKFHRFLKFSWIWGLDTTNRDSAGDMNLGIPLWNDHTRSLNETLGLTLLVTGIIHWDINLIWKFTWDSKFITGSTVWRFRNSSGKCMIIHWNWGNLFDNFLRIYCYIHIWYAYKLYIYIYTYGDGQSLRTSFGKKTKKYDGRAGIRTYQKPSHLEHPNTVQHTHIYWNNHIWVSSKCGVAAWNPVDSGGIQFLMITSL